MSDFLATMAAGSRERAEALPARIDPRRLDRPVFPLVLESFDLVAEIKDRSPAEGELAGRGLARADRALEYARAGAAAISVLTEPSRFDGALAHLDEVAAAVATPGLPVMRKDFLVDVRQVHEARAYGASGVLLIAAMLDDKALRSMLDAAAGLGMFVLLEAFDDDDLARCGRLVAEPACADRAAAGQLLVGLNTRDLRTLEVDTGRLERLAPMLPGGARAVAESGLTAPGDAARVAGWGYSLALVGTALMRSPAPARLVADMLHAGRGRRAA